MPDVRSRLRQYQADASACTRCRDDGLLHHHTDGTWALPLFTRDPTGRAGVLVVAEAPNLDDTFDADKGYLTYDRETDPTGRFARMLLHDVAGLEIADVVFTNAVLCLPAKAVNGKFPVTARQRQHCSSWLERLIDDMDPQYVVTLGGAALDALRGVHRHELRLGADAGQLHPWHGRQLLPLYHPGRLGRVARPASRQVRDVAALREALGRPGFPSEGGFGGPRPGERCGMTKTPGYSDKPWHTVVTIGEVSKLDSPSVTVRYVDHLYAHGVQDMTSAGLALPPDEGAYLRVWEERQQRRVDFHPLTWEFVKEKVMPGLRFERERPLSLEQFLAILAYPAVVS